VRQQAHIAINLINLEGKVTVAESREHRVQSKRSRMLASIGCIVALSCGEADKMDPLEKWACAGSGNRCTTRLNKRQGSIGKGKIKMFE